MQIARFYAGLYGLLIISDFLIFRTWRRFLFDFLAVRRSNSLAKMLAEQSIKDRITLDFIFPLLKKNKETFSAYHAVYKMLLYTMIPVYIVVAVCHLFMGFQSEYVFYVVAGVKIFFASIVRVQQDGSHNSKYRSYRRGRKR